MDSCCFCVELSNVNKTSKMAAVNATSSDVDPEITLKRKGKKSIYKSEIIKKARLCGEEYVNYKGNVVPALGPGEECR